MRCLRKHRRSGRLIAAELSDAAAANAQGNHGFVSHASGEAR